MKKEQLGLSILADRICTNRHADFHQGVTGWAYTIHGDTMFVAACVSCQSKARKIWDNLPYESLENS